MPERNAADEIDRLRADNAELLAALKGLEWVYGASIESKPRTARQAHRDARAALGDDGLRQLREAFQDY